MAFPDTAKEDLIEEANSSKLKSKPKYDRSIIEGSLPKAVWKLAAPTMVANIFGGLQGLVDHITVGNVVGYTGNAAIGVSWQIFLVVVVFIS
jgi:Na+-driven multidrug efflux pump